MNSEAYVVRQMSKDNELIIAQEKKQSIHLFVQQIKRFKELKTEILELETKLLESKTELLELEKALISQGGEYTKTILAGISKVDS